MRDTDPTPYASCSSRRRSSIAPARGNVMVTLASEGMTMICGTHQMRVARCVIFMDRGEIVRRSAPEEFITDAKNERTQRFLSQIPKR